MHVDLQAEMKYLHSKITEKRIAFDQGMKNDIEFGELKKIYVEIKQLEEKLHQLFEQNTGKLQEEIKTDTRKLTGSGS